MNSPGRRLDAASTSELAAGVLASAGIVALVTATIAVLDGWAPILSLGALYVLAVLPIAVVWGLVLAVPAAVASVLAFNWFFLPPRHTFSLSDGENWLALVVYVVVAVVTSELAVRSRRRALLAEQREREGAVLASISTSLLRGEHLDGELDRIAADVGEVLGVSHARITLGVASHGADEELDLHELSVDDRRVGTLALAPGSELDASVLARFLPALASLLAVASDRDQLQREALEAETLRRSDAVKTALLRAVSHDLRSPLTAIRAAADGLTSPALDLDDNDRAGLVEAIAAESQRLERLVADLLDLSRVQTGSMRPRRELWTLDAIVGLACDETAGAGRVAVALPEDLPPVNVDATQVRRVLANLFDNALQISPADSTVRVTGETADGNVVVHIADEGPGIAEVDLERIFEPFQRGSDAPAYRGSGLGLAIARGFAEANGGRLWAEPDAGRGAVLSLALPAADAPVVPA